MHRVITRYRNGTARPIIERGPWHTSLETAETWQDLLRGMGYFVEIESQHGAMSGAGVDNELADALASMA